jgi:hypothetical protein
LRIYNYSFHTTAIQKDGSYSIWNIQDPIQEQPRTFEQRILYNGTIKEAVHRTRDRVKLYKVLTDRIIEVKASEFGPAVDNANLDCRDPNRSALLIQSLIDEIYPILGLKKPNNVTAIIEQDGDKHKITYNLDLKLLASTQSLKFHLGSPLVAAAQSNRLLWSAANLNSDIYIGRPMSTLIGDKLYESGIKTNRIQQIIERLDLEVEFPDLRSLVNQGILKFDDIQLLRRKGKLFRRWLQTEGERDRNAIIAYHNEVSKETGLFKYGRRSLEIFGVIGGAALGGYIGEIKTGISGALIGSALGAGSEYLLGVASKLGDSWRPVVFGNWMKEKIEKIISER